MTRFRLVPSVLVALGALALSAASAHARPWKGLTPGKTLRTEVETKYGKPARSLDNQGKCAAFLVYGGEQRIPGATQAQFCFDAGGKLIELRVFPEVKLDADTVKEAFGEEYRKRLTDDFLTYWHYERDGMVVFFEKDSRAVSAILYVEGKAPSPGAPKKKTPDTSPGPSAEGTPAAD
jgi:hypothetical protein